jgi:beta-aspartyl-peptidase (threonine type)
MLCQKSSAIDVVVRAVVELEDEPAFNAGIGSCLTEDGQVEMDASLMDGATLRAGAVGAVRTVRNPIRLAQAIMDEGRHVFLVDEGAERFARHKGFPEVIQEDLVTVRQRQRWKDWQQERMGTVGAVALDTAGHVAAATSTGGISHKQAGRIGDSAIIGAGTYADDTSGAASATGEGEAIIRVSLAKTATEGLREGKDPMVVAQMAIALLGKRTGGEGGIILVDTLSRVGYAYNTGAMSVAMLVGDTIVVQD